MQQIIADRKAHGRFALQPCGYGNCLPHAADVRLYCSEWPESHGRTKKSHARLGNFSDVRPQIYLLANAKPLARAIAFNALSARAAFTAFGAGIRIPRFF